MKYLNTRYTMQRYRRSMWRRQRSAPFGNCLPGTELLQSPFKVQAEPRVMTLPAHLKRYDANHYSIEIRNKRKIKH